ncbi:MAG: PepSY-like domain-containing protein [Prevotella sp.]|nr:PepSY-like domain-containing protein [Prevotella sp.]MBR7042858.1 PepSY-like domain-containing protein [Prevotella sp.]MBR7087695.1 PepSY-like domain-containing protein [Prevotella sp.]
MKTSVKIMMLFCALFVQTAAFADLEKPVTLAQLPAAAQQTIKKHFADRQIALAKVEIEVFGKTYDVIFTNGEKIEFDSKGQWRDIECRQSRVPAALIPAAIANYVKKNYPQTTILKIERDRRTYEIELSNHLELKFNNAFQLIDIDD